MFELKEVLRSLKVSSSGGKSDLLARLQVVLMERQMSFEDAMEVYRGNQADLGLNLGGPAEGNLGWQTTFGNSLEAGGEVSNALLWDNIQLGYKQDVETGDRLGLLVNAPPIVSEKGTGSVTGAKPKRSSRELVGDSQVQADNCGAHRQVQDDVLPGDSVSQTGNKWEAARRDDLGSLKLLGRGRADSAVSAGSRNGSCVTALSALEKRREMEVKRVVEAAKEVKLGFIEARRNETVKARLAARREMEEEKRRQERELEDAKRRLEEQEELEEIELQAEIKALEREARAEALRVETEAWAKYEEMDLEKVQEVGYSLQRLNIEELINKGTGKSSGEGKAAAPSKQSSGSEGIVQRTMGREHKIEPGIGAASWEGGTANHLLQELAASNARMCMPKHEIEVFSGDAAQYTIFRGAMQEINGSPNLSYKEKLHFLYQYTRGEPRKLVMAALYMDSKQGFQSVWRWYEEQYGSPEMVGAQFLNELLSVPPIARMM